MKAKKPIIKLINTHQAKSQLSRLMKEVEEEGVLVRICRNGKPVVELRPISPVRDPFEIHAEVSKIKILTDPSEPVSSEDWPDDLR